MSAPLVTLEAAKWQLHIPATDTHDDAELAAVIAAASEIIRVYLKEKADPAWDANSTPADVQAAVKLQLGYLWTHRDFVDDDDANTVKTAIRHLLIGRRDPAMA